jgi:hypothetical protein
VKYLRAQDINAVAGFYMQSSQTVNAPGGTVTAYSYHGTAGEGGILYDYTPSSPSPINIPDLSPAAG